MVRLTDLIFDRSTAYTTTELVHQLKDSSAETVFCHPSILEVALASTKAMGWSVERQRRCIVLAVPRAEAGAITDYLTFDRFMDPTKLLTPVTIADPKTTVAYLGYSSGTSGAAKGVRTSHYNMTSVLTILYPFDVTQHDVTLAVLPLNHIYGLAKLLHWPILIGSPVVIQAKFELKQFCEFVEKYKVTLAMLVPPIFLALAREKIVDNYDMSSLNLLISGAAPCVHILSSFILSYELRLADFTSIWSISLGPELEKQLAKRLGCNVAQAYGLTESSPTTHYCPVTSPRPGSIGPLLPMLRSRICDPVTGEDVAPGVQGELLIQGPSAFSFFFIFYFTPSLSALVRLTTMSRQ